MIGKQIRLAAFPDLAGQFRVAQGGTPKAVTKEVVGVHVLLTRSFFGGSILRSSLRRVSLVKPTSAAEVLDMTDTAAIRDLVERSFAQHGRIDVIISNAGYGLFGAPDGRAHRRERRRGACTAAHGARLTGVGKHHYDPAQADR
jgi:NAD(P)-dependent dehydrogenase (short-subunit alcohol dehydrogenase family)